MTATMRAVVVDGPGDPGVLRVRDVPMPTPRPGWVLIRVEAFGLNRSELHFRSGVASTGSFPRIPGIEAVGTIADAPGGEYPVGAQVAAMMGGMGRSFDGGYAEYVSVPAAIVVPFTSGLGWGVLGAVPEMLQTAAGSLRVGLQAADGQSLLIRGGTSSVGLALATLGALRGMRVLSTTRNPSSVGLLEAAGADHVIIDDGEVARRVREIVPGGVDGAVELVGVNVLRDTLRAVRAGGTVCFTGMLSDTWTIDEFYPMDWLPNGVRLTAYSGEAADLTSAELQAFLDAVAAGHARVPLGRVYRLDEIVQAHRDMEAGTAGGKLVVLPR
ncbi:MULTISPECIES: zinc-binding dehydrogenase [unclassified Cryobacterium]|uniref:zinc-binding dehydrogenase n=1 Tax=unclassified Cryobacterium TaxID=2649013 RepID=UPI001068FE0F|nr:MULTISPECIES: zinc-binding dehydrogenase [unclassified Cryobacterium]TFB93598.1 NADPH:quinone reductase [Cryobacterium sp. MDB2-A-1]TFC10126.1 NADPH:quinone reductase [Cryobacterium sp. MDB2-33-2]TFC11901.1 NADPH:quinone reductase [Cryobacterium sp. MDB2-A-2]TFC13426.1 NADPH:quinone reductase [Cryobacterium sp. MDB2-10]